MLLFSFRPTYDFSGEICNDLQLVLEYHVGRMTTHESRCGR